MRSKPGLMKNLKKLIFFGRKDASIHQKEKSKPISQRKCDGMLECSFGGEVISLSLQHFIAPTLDLMRCLQPQGLRDCNKGIQSKKGAVNCSNEW